MGRGEPGGHQPRGCEESGGKQTEHQTHRRSTGGGLTGAVRRGVCACAYLWCSVFRARALVYASCMRPVGVGGVRVWGRGKLPVGLCARVFLDPRLRAYARRPVVPAALPAIRRCPALTTGRPAVVVAQPRRASGATQPPTQRAAAPASCSPKAGPREAGGTKRAGKRPRFAGGPAKASGDAPRAGPATGAGWVLPLPTYIVWREYMPGGPKHLDRDPRHVV